MGKKVTTFLYSFPVFFILALLVRLLFIYPQYAGDIHNHIGWGQGVLQNPNHIFTQAFSGINTPNYPPLTLGLFAIAWKTYQLSTDFINVLHYQSHLFPGRFLPFIATVNMQAAFLKLPAVFADLGIGYLIFRWFSKEKKRGAIAASLYLFNPAVIYISTVWGQIESIPLFFLLLSLLLSFNKDKKYQLTSHVAFTLAVLSKQTALWLLPIYIFVWLRESNIKIFIQGMVLQSLVFFASFIPFGYLPWESIKIYLSTLSGSSNVIADSAWNIWFWIYKGARVSDDVLLGPLSVRVWSIILLAISYLGSVLFLIKKYSKNNVVLSLFFISLVDFFIQTRVHERHLAPVLVFLLLVTFRKKAFYYFSCVLVTMYHLFNLLWALKLPFI